MFDYYRLHYTAKAYIWRLQIFVVESFLQFEVGHRLAGIEYIPRFYETEILIRFLPYAQFSVNRALRIDSTQALQKQHSQRLDHEDSATKVEAEKQLRNLASTLKEERRERTEAFRSDESTEHMHGARIPPSPTKQVLFQRRPKCSISHLLKDETNVSDLPRKIESTCILCSGNSKLGKNSCTVVIDQRPRWTRTTPPKYVERRLRCKNCGKARRCLPINTSLESLPDATIQAFYRCSQGLSQCDQLLMLQRIPSAARNHRWQAPKGQRMRTNRVNQYRDLMPLYFESREDTTVHKMCFKCSRREIDMGPRWLKGTDVCYARDTRSCSTPGCKGSRCNMIPADGSMKYIKYRDLIDRVEGGQKFAYR